MHDLFEADATRVEMLYPGAALLRGFARPMDAALLEGVHGVVAQAPLRNLITPGGQRMSVAMTNCGSLGWVSDRSGYRYEALDPLTGKPWPRMPAAFVQLAADAAAVAGFADFAPEA